MKKLSLAILILFALIFSISQTYSQNTLEIDSIRTGLSYKFVLYDDTEIIGKVTAQDSIYIKVAGDGGIFRLKKEDVFFISRNLARDNFKTILSLGGGVSFLNSGDGNYGSIDYKGKFALQLSALFPLGENKGLRVDAGYSKWKKDEFTDFYPNNNGYSKFGAETKESYSLKGDFVYGIISPASKFWIYGTAGLGVHYLIDGPTDHSSSYYSSYDSTYHNYSYHIDGRNYVSAVLSIGCALGYRFSKQLGFYVDAQLNTTTREGFFLFFWGGGGSYIPVRAGITYIIY